MNRKFNLACRLALCNWIFPHFNQYLYTTLISWSWVRLRAILSHIVLRHSYERFPLLKEAQDCGALFPIRRYFTRELFLA